jgi:hypothetical protein
MAARRTPLLPRDYRNFGTRTRQRTVQACVTTATRRLGWRARWLLPAVGIVLASASCGVRPAATPSNQAQPSGSTSAGSTSSGSTSAGSTALVSGLVETGSGCPVQLDDGRCKARRLADVQVEARPLPAGTTVSTRTRGDGHYSLRLGQGRYMLVVVLGQGVPNCSQMVVSVTSAASVRVDIRCDSGIR